MLFWALVLGDGGCGKRDDVTAENAMRLTGSPTQESQAAPPESQADQVPQASGGGASTPQKFGSPASSDETKVVRGEDLDDGTPASTQEASAKPKLSISDPLKPEEMKTPLDDFVTPDQIAAKAFQPPPGAKQLSPANLWIDRKQNRVYADGYIATNDGPLEMFACPAGTKEHESVVASLAKAKEIHAGLLAIGARPGKPVQFRPEFIPASGQRIRVWICYFDENKVYQVADGRSWVKRMGKDEALEHEWVFAGSKVWTDPSDGVAYYQADGGDMICVSNFGSALMDIQVKSSANTDALQFEPYTKRIPERFTPVRIVMVPIDQAANQPEEFPQPPQRQTVFVD